MHLSLLYTLFSTHSKRRITQEIQEEGQQPTNIPKEENHPFHGIQIDTDGQALSKDKATNAFRAFIIRSLCHLFLLCEKIKFLQAR